MVATPTVGRMPGVELLPPGIRGANQRDSDRHADRPSLPTARLLRWTPRPSAELVGAVATIVVAYHYSLQTLVRNLGVDTPLAYLGLVPLIALVLAAARHREADADPPIHDRELDYIIGVPLLAAALVMMVLLPTQLSTLFWVWRVDLLSMPLFVGGVVSVVFGCRSLWRLRFPIVFLLLAWPLPYTVFISSWLQAFTEATVAGLRWGVGVVPVARSVPSADGSLFSVTHGSHSFEVSVASACAGVNGMVGFLLAGAAFASVVRGRLRPKLIWLAGGLALIWALNVARIMLIFAGGQLWGERVAIDGLHPYIGLVIFCLGVVGMIVAMPVFGLHMAPPGVRTEGRAEPGPGGTVVTAPPTTTRPKGALVLVGVLAVVMGLLNADLRHYELVASDLGAPRLASLAAQPARPAGWAVSRTDTYAFAKRFFGDDSTWIRLGYVGGPAATTPAAGSVARSSSVIADVITTSDLRSFSTYGLEACYRFHGYKIQSVHSVDLGGGITGNVVSYYNTSLRSDWTALYWHWPVSTPKGNRFERVTLMMRDTAKSHETAPPAGPSLARSLGLGLHNSLRGDPAERQIDAQLAQTRAFITAFAQSVVQAQPAATPAA